VRSAENGPTTRQIERRKARNDNGKNQTTRRHKSSNKAIEERGAITYHVASNANWFLNLMVSPRGAMP